MRLKIWPSKVKGEISAPPSKSYTHRAIILASLANGQSVIRNCLIADDTLYTLNACRLLGIKADLDGKVLKITGSGGNLRVNPKKNRVFVGNSGTTIRLMTSVAALAKKKVILDGEKRLRGRPITDLLTALKDLGVQTRSINNNGCPPVEVKGGNLSGGKVEIRGSVSSQYISSLLLISPFVKRDMRVKITDDLKSKPYVEITIGLMEIFGVNVRNDNYKEFLVKAGQRYKAINYRVEGDYSSAAYFFAAAAVTNSKVTVKDLNADSVQGDRHFLDLLERMGCQVKREKSKITVTGSKALKEITVDMEDYPDIVQTLASVAAYVKGITKIKTIGHLRYKETDRLKATASELSKMGIKTETKKDSITIYGGEPKGAEIDTFNDHRMAMSFAIAGLRARGEMIINKAEVVSKSYPQFFEDLKKLGVKIEEVK